MTTTNTNHSASLYERLGGGAGIEAIVDDIVLAHMENSTINARFLPYLEDPETLRTIKEHTCQFLAAGSGGAETYEGRSMAEAHRGMNVSEAEYLAAIDDILATLRKHDVDEASQQEVLGIAYSLKDEILHV